MAMTLLTDNDNEINKMTVKVLNRLSGSAPSIVILDAIHESYRKICEETEAWILNTVQTVSAENCLYDATGGYEINIRRVISVKLRKKGQTTPFERIYPVEPQFYELKQNGIYFYDPNRIKMFDEGVIEIISAITPTRANEYIDEEMYEKYANAIIYGAIAELSSQLNRPWYSEQMFSFYNTKFNEELTHIMADASSKNKTVSEDFSG